MEAFENARKDAANSEEIPALRKICSRKKFKLRAKKHGKYRRTSSFLKREGPEQKDGLRGYGLAERASSQVHFNKKGKCVVGVKQRLRIKPRKKNAKFN